MREIIFDLKVFKKIVNFLELFLRVFKKDILDIASFK